MRRGGKIMRRSGCGARSICRRSNFWINAIVIATVGAIILRFILKLVRR
jgi:uncharacterized membrane protein YeaQ/YmgE (transglycosylase-associated protein family)